MIAKNLVEDVINLKIAVEQQQLTISDIKEIIAKPIEELYQMKESLTRQASPYGYAEFHDLY